MIRRHSKKIQALVLSLSLTMSAVSAPAVFASSDNGNNTSISIMTETTSETLSTAKNTFTWSGNNASATTEDTGYTISGGTVMITESGTYVLTGSGTGNVDIQADGVTLIADGLDLTSNTANTIETSASDTVIQITGENTLTNNWNESDGEIAAICSLGQTISLTGTGTLNLKSTGEDGSGIHADYTLNIGTEDSTDGPTINIETINEGIEALTFNLYSGTGTIVSEDDGINADNDADESLTCNINILGGKWTINSSSDGLDSNGNITISGGTTIVYGSEENGDAAIDFDGQLSFTGGLLLGIGMNGMAQTPTTGNYVQFSNISNITKGSTIEIRDTDGKTIFTSAAVKNADDVVLASNDLNEGNTYVLYVDGTEKASAKANSTGSTGDPGQEGQPGQNGPQPPDWNEDQNGEPPLSFNSFTDVASTDYFAEPVYWAAASKITTGTSETTFSPSDTTTRAQIVTFLWRMAGSPEPSSTESAYTDINKDSYYYKAVLWAAEKGITTGTSESNFSPDADCTRSQIVTFLHRYAETPSSEQNNTFTDVDTDAYYADAVSWAAANSITNGTSETTFSPEEYCTRGQAVTFLYNYAKMTGQAGSGMVPPTGERPDPPSGEVPSGNLPEPPSGDSPSAPSANENNESGSES